jgi:hypothetical protein
VNYSADFAHMAALDSWPRKWRELAYDYGLGIVDALKSQGGGYEAVKTDLETWRERRQAELACIAIDRPKKIKFSI